jgi:hypothetical protein
MLAPGSDERHRLIDADANRRWSAHIGCRRDEESLKLEARSDVDVRVGREQGTLPGACQRSLSVELDRSRQLLERFRYHGWWSSDLSSTNRSWGPRKCSKAVLTLGFATSFAQFPYLYDLNENQVLAEKQQILLSAILWPRQNIKLHNLTTLQTTRGSTAFKSTSAWGSTNIWSPYSGAHGRPR